MAATTKKGVKAGAKTPKAAVKSAKPAKEAVKAAPKSKKVSAEVKPAKAPKAPKEPKVEVEKTPREIIEKVLESPLTVFNRKDLTKKSTNIQPGASVFIEKLDAVGPTGSHLVRVKRAKSPRTYYTTEENLG